jgi:uncharacterized protein involved in exopolysaccharide biosynthesis
MSYYPDHLDGVDRGTSLIASLHALLRQRVLIVGIAIASTLTVIGLTLTRDRTYSTTTSFVPQARRTGTAAAGLAAQFGLDLGSAESSQSPQFYADLLTSRALLGDLVDRPYTIQHDGAARQLAVADVVHARGRTPPLRREDALARVRALLRVSTSAKTSVVSLTVQSPDPQLSVAMAARALAWINHYNVVTRQSQARAEREFTEQRLRESKADLARAEEHLLAFSESNRSYAQNSALALERARLQRELDNQQRLYAGFSDAFEKARVDEVRDTPVISVVEPAEVPVRPDPRGLVLRTLLALAGGMVLGVLCAGVRESLRSAARRDVVDYAELRRSAAEAAADVRHPLRALRRTLRSRAPTTT